MRPYVLDISVLKANLCKGGRVLSATFSPDGASPILIVVDTTDPSAAYVELHHRTRDGRAGDRWVRDRIRLSQTVPTYGGSRWWFLCPRTGHRTNKPFLPNGGAHFWSRQAYGLGYASQREDRLSRFRRRAAAFNRQLGGEGWSTSNIPAAKPKWMRWRTYDWKIQQWRRAVGRAEYEWLHRVLRLPDRRGAPGDDRAKRPGRATGRGVPRPQ